MQLEEVVEAADALLGRGLKPTIERVRQHLGGGSPNTISPMLDVWFERLFARVAGVAVPTEDDLPPNLRNAWNHGKHEARTLANEALLTESSALAQGRAQLSADQAEMARREEQWVADLGGHIVRDPATDLIDVNREFTVSVVLVRCRRTAADGCRWKIRLDTGLAPDITVAVRLYDGSTPSTQGHVCSTMRLHRPPRARHYRHSAGEPEPRCGFSAASSLEACATPALRSSSSNALRQSPGRYLTTLNRT